MIASFFLPVCFRVTGAFWVIEFERWERVLMRGDFVYTYPVNRNKKIKNNKKAFHKNLAVRESGQVDNSTPTSTCERGLRQERLATTPMFCFPVLLFRSLWRGRPGGPGAAEVEGCFCQRRLHPPGGIVMKPVCLIVAPAIAFRDCDIVCVCVLMPKAGSALRG